MLRIEWSMSAAAWCHVGRCLQTVAVYLYAQQDIVVWWVLCTQ
jgi:hypothetical protein